MKARRSTGDEWSNVVSGSVEEYDVDMPVIESVLPVLVSGKGYGLHISWNMIIDSNLDSYDIQYSTDMVNWTDLETERDLLEPDETDHLGNGSACGYSYNLPAGARYFYRMRARFTDGTVSPWSNIVTGVVTNYSCSSGGGGGC